MRITKENTAALFVDLQERLIPAMDGGEEVVRRSVILLEGLKAMGIPMLFLRQYPKGLGDIVPELRAAMEDATPFDKLAYSAMGDEAIAAEFAKLKTQGIQNILVCGVESHVCVLQSCIDLVAAGFQPLLVADCVTSRNAYDKKIALKRAIQENILLTTVESALFELCVIAGTDEFKAISKLVR